MAREHFQHGDYDAALLFCERYSDIAEASHNRAAQLVRDRIMALSLHLVGRHAEARPYAERALNQPASLARSVHKSFHEYDNRMASRSHLSRILWVQGYPDRAAVLAREGVEHALSLEYPPPLCYILVLAACPIAFWTGDMEAARRYTRLLFEQTANLSSSYWQSWGHCYRAAMGLSADGGSDTFHEAVRSLRVMASQPGYTDMLATIQVELAGPEAIARAVSGNTSWCAPEVLRAQAVGMLKQGDAQSASRAEATCLHSLALAREQGARSWELRTATTLARLYQGTGRAIKAHQLLAPVYSGFSEGFGTADLMGAAALLNAL